MPKLYSKQMIVFLMLVIVSISWILGAVDAIPYPYSKTPFGISIGIMTSFFIAGPTFLMWNKTYPNVLLVAIWSYVYFAVTGSFKFSLSEMHITTASSHVSLFCGYTIGIFFIYWIRSVKIKNTSSSKDLKKISGTDTK